MDGTPTGGGDSSNRIGHFWFCFFACLRINTRLMRIFPKQTVGLNQAILINWDHNAHCVARHWKGYPNAFDKQYGTSRDQFLPITIAALYAETPRGIILMLYAARRLGQMPNFRPLKGDWNGDFLLPDHWSSVLRAYKHCPKYLYPIIWLGDVWRVGSVLTRIACLKRDKDDTGDSLNLTMELTLGLLERPNFITRFAAWLFSKYSPISIQEQLDSYFAPQHSPPINELYRPIISELFVRRTPLNK